MQDLYRTICRISYMGDIRMGIAEDADKVDRIVAGSFNSFEALYGRRMIQGRVAESAQLARSYTGSWRQTPSRAAHLQLTSELPMVRVLEITLYRSRHAPPPPPPPLDRQDGFVCKPADIKS